MKYINIKTLALLLSASVVLGLTGCDSETGVTSDSQLVGSAPIVGTPPAGGTPRVPISPAPPVEQYASVVFTANTNESSISVFSMDEANGALTSFGKFNTLHENPTDLIIHPNGKFLIVMNSDADSANGWEDNGSVEVYGYNPLTGAASLLSVVPVEGMALNGAITPDGKYLYVTDQSDFELTSFSINAETGMLTELDFSPTDEDEAHAIVMHPSGQFFYVGSEDDIIHGHEINSTSGEYSDTPNTPYDVGYYANNWLSVTPNGKYLYTSNAENDAQEINGFSIDSTTGELTLLPGFPVLNPDAGLKSNVITPSGKYLYVTAFKDYDYDTTATSDSSAGTVTGYKLEDNGSISIIDSKISGKNPKSVTVDTSGKFLYVANYGDNNITAFSINDSTGSLTTLDSYSVGEGPKRVIAGSVPLSGY